MTTETNVANPIDWTMEYAEGVPVFPFVEDENCNITGYGHQDPEAFAAEVNRYDEVANGEPLDPDDLWGADHIGHVWVVLGEDGESLKRAEEDTPGAFPVTELWGAR